MANKMKQLPIAVRDTPELRARGERSWGRYRGTKCVRLDNPASPWFDRDGLSLAEYDWHVRVTPELRNRLPELDHRLVVCTRRHGPGAECHAEVLCSLARAKLEPLKSGALVPELWMHLPYDVLWNVLLPLCSPACYYALSLTSKRSRKLVLERGDVGAWVDRSLSLFLAKMTKLCAEFMQSGVGQSHSVSNFVDRLLRSPTEAVRDAAARLFHERVAGYWLHVTEGKYELLQRIVAKYGARQTLLRSLATAPWARQGGVVSVGTVAGAFAARQVYELFAQSGHAAQANGVWHYRLQRGGVWVNVHVSLQLLPEEIAELAA
jgi:hypothetical protein